MLRGKFDVFGGGGGILTYRSKIKKGHKMIKMVNDDRRANTN